MRLIYLSIFIFISTISVAARQSVDSILLKLDEVIENRQTYYDEKYKTIEELRMKLSKADDQDQLLLYDINKALFDEYGSFIYDSAFYYANQMLNIACKSNNQEMISVSKMKMSFVLLSSGMFHEALDTLNTIIPDELSDLKKVEYFDLKARAYYDMTEYANDPYFAPIYNKKGNEFTRKAIQYGDPESYQKWASIALYNLRRNQLDSALFFYRKVLNDFDVSLHQKAMVYAAMAVCSLETGDTVTAVSYYAESAINDIKSVVTETIALRNLANILFYQGKVKEAHKYIVLANKDAGFYGARQRSFQISGVLPIIEGEKLGLIENQKKQLEFYVIILALLSLLIIFSLVVIFKQLTGLKKARATIIEANNNLKSLNDTLKEANKIKEEYIAYYFNISTNYVDKLEHLKESISRNLENKRYSNIDQSLSKLSIKKERDQLFHNFDKIFLSIFPDFVDGFNALFEEENRVYLSENGAMNTDLRIFALIRMGIFENEKIARILNFSINTIYSYKNRIKKRSLVPNNEFEERIMEIKSV
ncbi:MAG: DUF6377 domain-containing protein [Bacteroidales bacterium]|nr:DUF6377 domain-containing protein [Bacteroidales bacterium]